MRLTLVFCVFTLIGVVYFRAAEALQCYVCENCVEGEELQELHICGELPVEVEETTVSPPSTSGGRRTTTTTPRTTRAPTTTVRSRRTTTPAPDADSEEYSYEEDYNEDEDKRRKRDIVVVPNAATTGNDKKFDYIEAAHDERHRVSMPQQPMSVEQHRIKKSKQSLPVLTPVCYMVKVTINDILVTNRGCTKLINGNDLMTCQFLYNGSIPEDCKLCNSNGCNKFDKIEEEPEDVDDDAAALMIHKWHCLLSVLLVFKMWFIF